jgi:putative transposase
VKAGPRVVRAPLTAGRRPNEVWTIDFKGWFRTGDGTRLEPLTVRDEFSRFILGIHLLARQNMSDTRAVMEGLFKKYGMPRVIRTDNGSPFGATGALGLTRLSAWWVRLGIRVEHMEPGHPEQNGAHEQMHRVYKAENLKPAAATPRAQRLRTRRWVLEYNYERPHEGLKMELPAARYRQSRRRMPTRLGRWQYPRGWESRLVKGNGLICWKGRSRFVGEAFEQQRVGLKRQPKGLWEVYFGPLLAGTFREGETGAIQAVVYRKKKRR